MKNASTSRLLTVKKAVEAGLWDTEVGLRWQIYHAKKTGLDSAIIRIGSKILIDEEAFWRWVDTHREGKAQ